MSDTRTTGPTIPDWLQREMRVTISPHEFHYFEYEGTSAQLLGEGVIPPTTEWPTGRGALRWDAGGFRWHLKRRTRRVQKDWWNLRCLKLNAPDVLTQRILDKATELAAAVYYASPTGQREWCALYERHLAATKDEAFQSFKTLIPGLIPPTRSGKTRAKA